MNELDKTQKEGRETGAEGVSEGLGGQVKESAQAGMPVLPNATLPRIYESLESFTPARVALQRAGNHLATSEILRLQLANAQARDAVYAELDVAALVQSIKERNLQSQQLRSDAPNREEYLRRPELGRKLDQASRLASQPVARTRSGAEADEPERCEDLVFVLADGLSALAVQRHALPLLDATLPTLDAEWKIAPICVVEQARVAIGDPIGEILRARISVVMIGERPGLSSPDSLGVYITWGPRLGRTDAERNCISNIRPEGLGYEEAAKLLHFYLTEARRLGRSGALLKPSGDVARLLGKG